MPVTTRMRALLHAAALAAAAISVPVSAQVRPAVEAVPDAATPRPATPSLMPAGDRQPARTQKPPLHGQRWMAITGKPLAAMAGARTFERGGNAVDAACAMIAATATMWDVLSWGGETQALIYDPRARRVVGINGLGVAPSGATPAYFRGRGMAFPPAYGPLAAITPGTPGGIMHMLAEYGTLSLADVLGPAIELADGYPIEAETADRIEAEKSRLRQWPYSSAVFLVRPGAAREAPQPGEIFRQPDLAATLRKLVEAERDALAAGKDRRAAIDAAFARFYRGDIAAELVRSVREQGGLITLEDLAGWRPRSEAPLKTDYRGIEVFKLDTWTQGPVLLQALNLLEPFDLKTLGYNSPQYVHTLYQAMSLAFADRDFYYGDPTRPPREPITGLLSKDYARARAAQIAPYRNDPGITHGDPYPFQGERNPFLQGARSTANAGSGADVAALEQSMRRGTTSVVAADAQGWLVAVTPSGGWLPAVIAGRTGIGLSQRLQSFVLDPALNPFNVLAPGQQPRVTLTPTLALKDGRPWLAFAVQGGDTQDQNLLQFFLNVVEFGMTPQAASEAANLNSYQLRSSFDDHASKPGHLQLNDSTPQAVREELQRRGYTLEFRPRTSGPINAILVDHAHGSFWGGSSNHGEDYGIAW